MEKAYNRQNYVIGKKKKIMNFKNLKNRFNAFAADAREKTRQKIHEARDGLKMATTIGVLYTAITVDRVKEKLFPSFWTSIENGDAKAVEEALKKNPALAAAALDEYGTVPLHCAAAGDKADVAAVLLAYGAKLDAEDHRGVTPLLIAAGRGNLPMIELFLQHNDPTLNKLVFGETETAVSAAAANGHADAVEMLHKGGARLDIATSHGATALTETYQRLTFAQKGGRADEALKLMNCLDYLERNIADVATGADRNANVYTSLMRVARDGYADLADTMLAADTADTVNQRYVSEEHAVPVHGNNEMKHCVNTALKEAIFSREPAMVECLLKHGAKQDVDYEGDMTPLMAAAWQGRADMLKLLLDNDTSTVNALHERKYEGFLSVKRVDFTHSALTLAVNSKDAAMVSMLLDHGARTDLATTKSPLQLAEEAGLTEIAGILKGWQLAQKPAAGNKPPAL